MIEALLKLGAEFDPGEAERSLDLGREGGHTRRRIVHHRDATGREIERALLARVRAHPGIGLFEDHCGVDLLTARRAGLPGPDRALGAYVLDVRTGAVERFRARLTLLATGGAGKVYLYTSNPDIASGDGMAMAFRAGATLANMEFVQFHPTCLFHPQAKSFLISEAVRGEGAVLRTRRGEAFMARYHPMADLAPRDVVARAIDTELKQSGDEWVVLDLTHRAAGVRARALPEHLCPLPGVRHRHHARADPGGAGGALHLRRRAHGSVRRDGPPAALRGRRGRQHRAARRQPAGLELAAGSAGLRRRRRQRVDRAPARARARRARGRRPGSRAARPRATRRS